MGASTFYQFAQGTDLRQAFGAATDHARYMHGHGGYSGTLAEKHSVVEIREAAGGLTYREAINLAHSLIDKADERIDDKWGPAGAIRVIDSSDPQHPRNGWLLFGWASS